MKRRTYRLCLFLVVLLVATIGIGYYRYLRDRIQNTEGAIVVMEEQYESEGYIS